MFGEFMAEGDRLRVLQVREAWGDRVRVLGRLAIECFNQIKHGECDLRSGVPQKQTKVGGDLIVTAAARAQFAAEIAEFVNEHPLDSGVDVLIGRDGLSSSGQDLGAELVDGLFDAYQLVVVQQPGARENVRVCASLLEVVGR